MSKGESAPRSKQKIEEGWKMGQKIRPSLEARLTRARLMMSGGRRDEGLEELRQAVLDAAGMSPREGRAQVEEVLRFSRDNEAFEDVEDTLENESLLEHFFGHDWK